MVQLVLLLSVPWIPGPSIKSRTADVGSATAKRENEILKMCVILHQGTLKGVCDVL